MQITAQDLLDSCVAAINAILSGAQSYSLSTSTGTNRTVTRANLPELRDMRAQLIAEVDREARGGFRVQYVR